MFKVYRDEDYIIEDGKYITTPEFDTAGELSIAVNLFLVIFFLGVIGVCYA